MFEQLNAGGYWPDIIARMPGPEYWQPETQMRATVDAVIRAHHGIRHECPDHEQTAAQLEAGVAMFAE